MFISNEAASIFMYLMESWVQNINTNFEDCTHCGFPKKWCPDDNLLFSTIFHANISVLYTDKSLHLALGTMIINLVLSFLHCDIEE